VEGQGTWMARTGWAFVRGARASVFGGGEILLTARQTRLRSRTEGQQEQSKAASKATMRTSTTISLVETA
jgi:hypothetical protein